MEEEINSAAEVTKHLINAGVDVIFTEMIKDVFHGPLALKGLSRAWHESERKVPVFFGTSARLDEHRNPVLWTDGKTNEVGGELGTLKLQTAEFEIQKLRTKSCFRERFTPMKTFS